MVARTTDVRLAIDGGTPVRAAPWPAYDNGDAYVADDDVAAALHALRSRRYFRYDTRPHEATETGALEAALCRYFGAAHALGCASGTTALALGLLALDLPAASDVICPAFTFAATPSAIILAGHRPVLVECDDDLQLDPDDLRRKVAAGARAIVVVHMRGFAADMPAIAGIADEFGVPIVEDAVPALGVRLHGRPLGTWGRVGAFSTQSDKALNTGEGGFVLTDDATVYSRAVVYSGAYESRMARHFTDPPDLDDLSLPLFSWRMDEIRAALARAQLARLPGRLAAHRRNYDRVAAALDGRPDVAVRRPVAPGAYLGEALLLRLPDTAAACWFARALRAEGIGVRAFGDPDDVNVRAFWNWRFLFPDRAAVRAAYPASTAAVGRTVDIPLSANLTGDDCAQLVDAVDKVAAALPGRYR
ncbi:UDP-4-amino-4-deoxy-L-arabinose--oxoglutarate aminotransferase [Actinocatenispora thailandica]|uniref:UDP-4-amino-4-deoxy-L-arabinose--oxoglutarate aminotransferase n=1 Tax=Actinocatenispora thailandica TaxID=227318 RepID=A0A7R7DVL4_9ACTN|nr:aminotransferase class I/II-fold pyridoxal phosphate-dependent enzyme [Actinocatenispora thailandica]BCJ38699.1 UDP-4-amino-4-deoxy-L-arabinose--oxoglutarate aminotransferase [Actinocatenispora thailandica]